MMMRTDLAIDAHELCGECEGVSVTETKINDMLVTRMHADERSARGTLGKPPGNYVTVEMPRFSDSAFYPDERFETVAQEISRLLPDEGVVLVVGLGNSSITPDALGPRTAGQVLATRHLSGELKRACGLEGLRPVAVLAPGVLGQTGIEVRDIIAALVHSLSPAAVIVIDALASCRLGRLGSTVQLSDAGISPGSGVGNNRPEISAASIGVPVISIGVPTVTDASAVTEDSAGNAMIVTPREIDLLTDRASRLLALAINAALHPDMDPIALLSAV